MSCFLSKHGTETKYTGSRLEQANRCKENCSLSKGAQTELLNIAVIKDRVFISEGKN